jgi:hypothetical protein
MQREGEFKEYYTNGQPVRITDYINIELCKLSEYVELKKNVIIKMRLFVISAQYYDLYQNCEIKNKKVYN